MVFTKEPCSKGIRFYSIQSNKFKTSLLTFSITVPATPEAVAYNLLLSGLFRRGTEAYPSMADINQSLDELYGTYIEIRSTNVGKNICFTLAAEVLDNKYIPDDTDALGGTIDVCAELLLRSLFRKGTLSPDYFEQERKITVDALNSEKNNTRAYSVRRCMELLQRDSSSPTLEQIKDLIINASHESVVKYYEYLLNNAPLDIFYVGATPTQVLKEKICSSFTDYPFVKDSASLNESLGYPKNECVYASEKLPVSQGKLTMGFNSGACLNVSNNDYYAALLLNELFGGSVSSKLFLNVREKMGLCYYCSSSYSIYTGLIIVSSGIESSKLDTVKSAVMEQLEEIKLGHISCEELANAKKSLCNVYTQLYDSPFDLQAFYSGRILFGIDATVEDCRKAIEALSAKDVSRIAKQIDLQAVFFVEGSADCSETEENDDD